MHPPSSPGAPSFKLLISSLSRMRSRAAPAQLRKRTNREGRGRLWVVSSSEPRLTPPATSASQRELTGDVDPLKSTVPFTTHVLLDGSMLLFFLAATLITLQTSWQWWLIPAAVAIPVAVILVQRYNRAARAREARRRMEAELRAAAPVDGSAGRPGTKR